MDFAWELPPFPLGVVGSLSLLTFFRNYYNQERGSYLSLRMPTMAPISTGPMACWAKAEGLNKGGTDRVCPAGSLLAGEVLVKGEVVLLEWHPCPQECGDQPVRAPAGTLCSALSWVAWVPEFCCSWQAQSGLLHCCIRSVFFLLGNCASWGDRRL